MAEEAAFVQHNIGTVEPFDILIDGNPVDSLGFDTMMDDLTQMLNGDDVVNHEIDFSEIEHLNVPTFNPAFENPDAYMQAFDGDEVVNHETDFSGIQTPDVPTQNPTFENPDAYMQAFDGDEVVNHETDFSGIQTPDVPTQNPTFENPDAYMQAFDGDEVVNHETDFSGIQNPDVPTQNPEVGNPTQIPDWPVPPVQSSCNCCQTLREILHFNDTHVQKLEIHGRIGIITHAVLERYPNGMSLGEREYYQMFDLSQQSLIGVKQFLVQYCDDRKREGFIMKEDPLFYFYDALRVGLEGGAAPVPGTSQIATAEEGTQMNQERNLNGPAEKGHRNRRTKTRLAVQRERMKTLTLKDLVKYFHLTENQAAKELQLSVSAVKKICRKARLYKWPCREIRKYESAIAKEQSILNTSHDADRRERASNMIEELRESINIIYDVARNYVQ